MNYDLFDNRDLYQAQQCLSLREHPFNLKGGRLWFFSESKYIFSLRRKFVVTTLFFFYENNIFISAHFRDRIFFSIKFADRIFFPKKTIAPTLPPPLQVKWMFPDSNAKYLFLKDVYRSGKKHLYILQKYMNHNMNYW